MKEWIYNGELCNTEYFEKGDKEHHIGVAFNKLAKNIEIHEDNWQSNGTPMLVPQNDVTRYSSTYGHFQLSCMPTLSLEDVEWILHKGKQIFNGTAKGE